MVENLLSGFLRLQLEMFGDVRKCMKGVHLRSEEVTEEHLKYTNAEHVPGMRNKVRARDNDQRYVEYVWSSQIFVN